MKKIATFGMAAVFMAAVATAAVTFDSTTGTGFVGKGDVQLALGWNNAQLQGQAGSLAFTYEDAVEYDVPCMKIIETKKETKINRDTFNRKSEVTAAISYDPRSKKQVNGFNLLGFGAQTVEGTIACPEGWDPDGDPILAGSTPGTLFVNGVAIQ